MLMKALFWDDAAWPCEYRRFGETQHLNHQGEKNKGSRNNVNWLLGTANGVTFSLILFTLKVEAIRSSETSLHTRATRRNIPEYGIIHSHRLEKLKSYIALSGWALQLRCNVSPVRYELGFYIPEDGILHSHRHENLKSYIALTAWTL
jgi:hypothetical protein